MTTKRRTWLVLAIAAVTVALVASACNPLPGIKTHDYGAPGSTRTNLIKYEGPSGGWLWVQVGGGAAEDLTVSAHFAGNSVPSERECAGDGVGGADDPMTCGGCNWSTPARLAWDNGATTGYRKLVRLENLDLVSIFVDGSDTLSSVSFKVTDDAGATISSVYQSDTGNDYVAGACGGGE